MANKIIDKNTFRVKEYPVKSASPRVVVVFTAMGTKIGLYRLFVKLMKAKGYSCLVYDYPLKLLFEPKLQEWEQFYIDIVADAQERIHQLANADNASFYAYGVSMGTLIANKFARETKEVKHLILNLTYGVVAQNIWTWKGVKKAKAGLMKQGVDQTALRESIKYADPITNASKLKGKKVLLYLTRNDKVLVYDQTKYTKKAFEEAELDLKYVENKYLGHYFSGTKNLLAVNRIDKFYKS